LSHAWQTTNRIPTRRPAVGGVHMLNTVSPSPEKPSDSGRVTDRRTTPPGVMPRHLQEWVLVGTAVVMVGIMALSGSPTKPRPSAAAVGAAPSETASTTTAAPGLALPTSTPPAAAMPTPVAPPSAPAPVTELAAASRAATPLPTDRRSTAATGEEPRYRLFE